MSVGLDRHDDGIVVLTLDDPERRNAMTVDMGDALRDATAELRDDAGLRAVVLTGTPPAFSAGGDLDMLEDLARRTREEGYDATGHMRAFYGRFLSVRDLPVPVVAAINGHAVGAGLCVALACDLRIVAEDAKVGLNFSRLGLHPGMGGSWLLARILGHQRAAEWLYTGRLVRGAEAAAQGLALEAVPAGDVLPRALALAGEIAAASPVTVRQLKRTLATTADADLDTALAREAACQAVSYGTDDLREGLAAGRERRTPDFPGR
ncbi:enoyl-CoA hydratase/isomerase family protein [Egicoccus halophilus]|uniref:Enoyl-CoA hydratase n=1 Tax=Egicoccus halophilus TaxID=1670830 RepID=A0A8J3ACA7_9ACTN|nr:enoyl-CoA hydratase-related protein [Egicoccus halophilus]GGI08282.1 enoyl-CoA hydratase [Egicoccus halophilus]